MNGFIQKLFSDPWLIERPAAEAMIRQIAGFDESMIRLAMDKAGKEPPPPYQVKDGIAVISIRGPLTKEPSFFSFLFGARTYSDITAQVGQAMADSAIDSILLDIDSPGGTVSGAFESAAGIAAAAAVKPIDVFANGQMTSAALLLGSPGRKIAAVNTTAVGSIGVVQMHVDFSAQNEKFGEKVTYLTAGKYKAYGNPDEPLSADAKAYFQDRLDRMYAMFIDAVSQYRGMSTDAVVAAADGRVFLADQARELGLVDTIVANVDDFLNRISQEDSNMDLNEFKTKHPDLYAQVQKQGEDAGRAAADTEAAEKIKNAGMEASGRVIAVVGVVAGEEIANKVKALADTGMTADQLQAVKGVLQPPDAEIDPDKENKAAAAAAAAGITDKESRDKILAAIENSGNQPLSGVKTGGAGGQNAGGQTEQTFMEMVEQHMEEKNCSKADAISAVRAKNPDAHKKWLEDVNKKTAE